MHCREKALHLGSFIGNGYHAATIDKAVSDLIYHTNILKSKYSFCTTKVNCKLINSFCNSLNGWPLWKNDFIYLNKKYPGIWGNESARL